MLSKFGVNYLNQDVFVNEFARNEAVHIEDLVTRMKNCVKQAYNMATSMLNKSEEGNDDSRVSDEAESLRDLRKTDYFDKVQMKLKNGRISLTELVDKMKAFDPVE